MELFANTKIFFYLLITAIFVAVMWRIGFLRGQAVLKVLFSKNNLERLTPQNLKFRRRLKDILFLL